MCFSPTASFTTAAILATSGAASLGVAARVSPRFIPINLLVFFFAIQQFSEGMIWIGSPWLSANTWGAIFLFFAFFVYPWYLGFAAYFLTHNTTRKKIIAGIVGLGFIFGAALFLVPVLNPEFMASATCCKHIYYQLKVFEHLPSEVPVVIYLLVTSLPYFITDQRNASILAWLIIGSAMICWFIYTKFFVSVWCFYAAIITAGISVLTCTQYWRKVKQLN